MGNNSSTSRGDDENSRGHILHNLTRVSFTSVRRMFHRLIPFRYRLERNFDTESYERLLNEDFSVYNTTHSDIAEHLVTVHVSYTHTLVDCIIYITGYNSNQDKIMEGVLNQDLTRNVGSECFMTYTEPTTGRSYNKRFKSPLEATEIKAFFEQFLNTPEANGSNN